jgi:hypothetical protein
MEYYTYTIMIERREVVEETILTYLTLGWVSGSCPRIQDDSSPHHSFQHECVLLASGFNSCIY